PRQHERQRRMPDDEHIAVENLGHERAPVVDARVVRRAEIADPAPARGAPDDAVMARDGRIPDLQVDTDAAADDDRRRTDRNATARRSPLGHDERDRFAGSITDARRMLRQQNGGRRRRYAGPLFD